LQILLKTASRVHLNNQVHCSHREQHISKDWSDILPLSSEVVLVSLRKRWPYYCSDPWKETTAICSGCYSLFCLSCFCLS